MDNGTAWWYVSVAIGCDVKTHATPAGKRTESRLPLGGTGDGFPGEDEEGAFVDATVLVNRSVEAIITHHTHFSRAIGGDTV